MLLNPINFILKVGKVRSSQARPSNDSDTVHEGPNLLPPSTLTTVQFPIKNGQSKHSNQMSS